MVLLLLMALFMWYSSVANYSIVRRLTISFFYALLSNNNIPLFTIFDYIKQKFFKFFCLLSQGFEAIPEKTFQKLVDMSYDIMLSCTCKVEKQATF